MHRLHNNEPAWRSAMRFEAVRVVRLSNESAGTLERWQKVRRFLPQSSMGHMHRLRLRMRFVLMKRDLAPNPPACAERENGKTNEKTLEADELILTTEPGFRYPKQ
jgi:hypothetical protein